MRAYVTNRAENPRNPVGLERSAVAIEFVVSFLDDAAEAIDAVGGDNDLYETMEAVHDMLKMIADRLERTAGGLTQRDPGMN